MHDTKVIKSPPESKPEGFMLNETIAIYAIIDDLVKAMPAVNARLR